MWDVKNGSLKLCCPHSSSEYVLSCDVSQDDKRLLSASVDRYAKVTKKSVNVSTNDFSELYEIYFQNKMSQCFNLSQPWANIPQYDPRALLVHVRGCS